MSKHILPVTSLVRVKFAWLKFDRLQVGTVVLRSVIYPDLVDTSRGCLGLIEVEETFKGEGFGARGFVVLEDGDHTAVVGCDCVLLSNVANELGDCFKVHHFIFALVFSEPAREHFRSVLSQLSIFDEQILGVEVVSAVERDQLVVDDRAVAQHLAIVNVRHVVMIRVARAAQ